MLCGQFGEIHARTQALYVIGLDQEGWAHVGCFRHEDGAYIEGYVRADKLYAVRPNDEYGIVIDKATQTLTLYREGRAVTAMPVSTGLMAKNKTFRETRAGAFITGDRLYEFSSDGYNYRYALRIDGGNLLHEIGYHYGEGVKPDFSDQAPMLGIKNSRGCVRLPNVVNAEGVSAFWLWANLPEGVKVLVIDDRAARDLRMRQIDPAATESPASPFERAVPMPAATPAPTLSPDGARVTVTLAGDCVIGGEDKSRSRDNSFDAFVA